MLKFDSIKNNKFIFLYAGDVPSKKEYNRFIGLSLDRSDQKHIKHDITKKMDLFDGSVECYQSEDVFEHIEIEKIPFILNEIHRVLAEDGFLRIAVPDYRCDILFKRSIKNSKNEIIFDPDGGGDFINNKVVNGGHVWFPKYEIIKGLIENSNFGKNYKFYHYYDELGNSITEKIDYDLGFISRTPDNDERVKSPYRAMSIVVDCYKKE